MEGLPDNLLCHIFSRCHKMHPLYLVCKRWNNVLQKYPNACWERSYVTWFADRNVPEEWAQRMFRTHLPTEGIATMVSFQQNAHLTPCKRVFALQANEVVYLLAENEILLLVRDTGYDVYNAQYHYKSGGLMHGKCIFRFGKIEFHEATTVERVRMYYGQYLWTGPVTGSFDSYVAHGKGTAIIDGQEVEAEAYYGLLDVTDYTCVVEGARKRLKK